MFYSMQSRGKTAHRSIGRFPDFEIVLQPIVDVNSRTVYAYEALCRGPYGENYTTLVANMEESLLPLFDKLAMARSMRLAAKLRIEERGSKISINVGPETHLVGKDANYIGRLAKHYGIKASSIVLEFSEEVRMDCIKLAQIVENHRAAGSVIAMDDFGAGYAGLNSLAISTPDVLKLDRELIKDIESSKKKKTIVGAFAKICRKIGVEIVAEGVETVAEFRTLQGFGISLMQGYLFARPAGCELPQVSLPSEEHKHYPRVSRDECEWFRNAIRQ
jgi:EAL domain-containing protein (putative c-di-GMP-specific phosphodiesterase class I)